MSGSGPGRSTTRDDVTEIEIHDTQADNVRDIPVHDANHPELVRFSNISNVIPRVPQRSRSLQRQADNEPQFAGATNTQVGLFNNASPSRLLDGPSNNPMPLQTPQRPRSLQTRASNEPQFAGASSTPVGRFNNTSPSHQLNASLFGRASSNPLPLQTRQRSPPSSQRQARNRPQLTGASNTLAGPFDNTPAGHQSATTLPTMAELNDGWDEDSVFSIGGSSESTSAL